MNNPNVDHPKHYNLDDKIECIEALKSALTDEEFAGFCKGNVFKYVWRYKLKNGTEDLEKAQWYLNYFIHCYMKMQNK